jgi:hypothetical protein
MPTVIISDGDKVFISSFWHVSLGWYHDEYEFYLSSTNWWANRATQLVVGNIPKVICSCKSKAMV